MSEMEVTESVSDGSNDLILLDRVFLRLGNADSDEQLESCLNKFLPPVILKLSSPHEQVRTKVMELLIHVNKRMKCRADVQLPVKTLLEQFKDPSATSFIINFSIIYITMGFPRLPRADQLALAPTLIEAIENKPQQHQDGILMLLMPLLGEIKETDLNLKEKPKLSSLIIRFATDILLLPYRALPNPGESDFQVPPGMSLKSYKRIVDKHALNPNQLEEMKLSIVNFISKDIFNQNDVLLPLIVAAADSRFSIANSANSPLIRVTSSVDWSQPSVVSPLYSLYLGTWGGLKVPPDDRKVPACTRLRLKLIQYLNKVTGAGVMFPHCVQVVFSSLFDPNSNSRLRNSALVYLLNVFNNGAENQLSKVAPVFLQGLLKMIRSEEFTEHHPKAYICLGRLATKCPGSINKQFSLLEELVKKIPDAIPEMRTALRDALLEMAKAYKITAEVSDKPEPMETNSEAAPSSSKETEKMDTDEPVSASETKQLSPFDDPQALALFALLDHYMHNEESMIRYIAMRYAAAVFPHDYIPSRYLLLLASGDSQDEISTEALKCLYGTSRPTEIDDVVNNVSKSDKTTPNLEHNSKSNDKSSDDDQLKVPKFKSVVNYIWDQMQKRKKGSNSKHRFVVNNQVLQFHPLTFQEILRYMRMCLNHDANLKDCSNHPNATSPLLAKYFYENLLDTEVLERYLTMITTLMNASPAYCQMYPNHDANLKDCSNHPNATSPLLAKYFYENLLDTEVLERYLTMITTLMNASPEIMPLTCFLDIIGCAPDKMSPKYNTLLPFLKNLFTNSTKEEIRENAASIYAIIATNTMDKRAIDKEIKDFVAQSVSNKSLEAQCGYVSAFANMCERCIRLSKTGKQFGGKGFSPKDWEPYQEGVLALGNFLASAQPLLVSVACTNLALLVRCSGLPLPESSASQQTTIQSDNPFNIGVVSSDLDIKTDGEITKFSIVQTLFKIVGNAKLASKTKEKALFTLGLLCCGENFPFAKLIIEGFLKMAKDSKEFEIHLQIGESLVLCVEGINSNENRDLWTELPREGAAKIRDPEALKKNDELLELLLQQLFKIGRHPHPHSRQATSIWLLALLKNCPERKPIQNKLQELQNVFMDFLSENSEIVQDVASKGLSLVYQSSNEVEQKALVAQIIDQLTSGKRSVAQVTEDTKLFEEGQLGKSPTGGNLSTYKELCSLASDLNQPDLLYKFMHLAHHNSMWNSKKGAAFGFHSIALQAGSQLSEHLPKIVPRLYRYRFDPTPRIQNSMAAIWHALVPETMATVHKYHKEILDDLVLNLTSNQWRVRMSCCNALAELLRGARSLHDSTHQLNTLWTQLFRVMDDVHEGTRQAATATTNVLSKLCVRASDVGQGKDGKEIVSVILPVLLDVGITNVVKEVRSISLQTVSKLVSAAGDSLKPFLPKLVPALVLAAGELESAKLSYLSTALGNDHDTREMLDDMRANAAKQHYTTDTVVKCMPFIDFEVMQEMLPKILELTRSPQLGTKVSCCHFFILATHHLRKDLEPIAGKIMLSLLNGAFDRNATVRKNYAEALGQVAACAKSSSVEKLMKKLANFYETKEDEIARSAVALILKSLSKAKIEMIKDNEEIIAPFVFLAMHGPKEDDSTTIETFEEIWSDISPGKETGIKQHLAAIREHIEQALASNSWTKKMQGAAAAQSVLDSLSVCPSREAFLRALLAAAHGKTYHGKEKVVAALASALQVKEGEEPLNPGLVEDSLNALLTESKKQDMVYQKHAITALGDALAYTNKDKFDQLYNIVKVILSKDETTVGKDSDEEDNEGARQRREQLISLKEAAYELLGKAWPKNLDTQEKYYEIFFEHCTSSYPTSSRSIQLAILASITRVLERIYVFNSGEPMEIDNVSSVSKEKAVGSITSRIATIIDYTLKNNNQVRHRRDALSIMDVLIRKLKELNHTEDINKLKSIYQTYASDLSKDSSHEIRTKLESIKVLLK